MAQQGVQGQALNLPPPPGDVVPLPLGEPPFMVPQAGAYLTQAQVVTNPTLSEEETIRQVLHWINFRTDVNNHLAMSE